MTRHSRFYDTSINAITHLKLIFTSAAGAVAQYCLSVCPRAYLLNHTRDLYLISVHVASGHGSILLRRGDASIRGRGRVRGFSSPLTMHCMVPYSGMNFVTKDQFGLNLLIYRKLGLNSISCYYTSVILRRPASLGHSIISSVVGAGRVT